MKSFCRLLVLVPFIAASFFGACVSTQQEVVPVSLCVEDLAELVADSQAHIKACSGQNCKICDRLLKCLIIKDFRATWTILAAIESDLDQCCATLNSKIDAIETTTGSCTVPCAPIMLTTNVITQPGAYCVPNNYNNFGFSNITIFADNVALDLRGQTVNLPNGMSLVGNQVTVKNGAIFGGGGSSSGINTFGSSGNTQNILIQDLLIFDCEFGGVNFFGVTNLFVERVRVLRGGQAGFVITQCPNPILEACAAENSSAGFQFSSCGGIATVKNCIATQNRADASSHGFHFFNQTSCFLDSCLSFSNTGNGFEFINQELVTVKNCVCSANDSNGFFVDVTNSAFTEYIIENCIAEKSGIGDGFVFNRPHGVITGCTSTANASNGFVADPQNIANVFDVTVLNCVASNNGNDGFNFALAGDSCVIGLCTSTINTGTGFVGNNSNTVLYSNNAVKNGTNYASTGPQSSPEVLMSAGTAAYGANLKNS